MTAGNVLVTPPYVPHEFYALKDTIDIDFFHPCALIGLLLSSQPIFQNKMQIVVRSVGLKSPTHGVLSYAAAL